MFETLKEQPADSLLALIKAFQDDPRAHKIDLGVGVYRDENGRYAGDARGEGKPSAFSGRRRRASAISALKAT